MSLFNNGFTRFCTSGFGTGTSAGMAAGYTLLIVSFGVILIFYVGKGIYKVVKKPKVERPDNV